MRSGAMEGKEEKGILGIIGQFGISPGASTRTATSSAISLLFGEPKIEWKWLGILEIEAEQNQTAV